MLLNGSTAKVCAGHIHTAHDRLVPIGAQRYDALRARTLRLDVYDQFAARSGADQNFSTRGGALLLEDYRRRTRLKWWQKQLCMKPEVGGTRLRALGVLATHHGRPAGRVPRYGEALRWRWDARSWPGPVYGVTPGDLGDISEITRAQDDVESSQ